MKLKTIYKKILNEAYGLHPDVLRQYLETALWASSGGEEDDFENFDDKYDIDDIAPESIKKAKDDLDKFINAAEDAGLLDRYLSNYEGQGAWGKLGHDFWLTRNGHGAGFWDRSYETEFDPEGDLGDKLTKIADTFRELNLFLGDDGKIYFE